METLVQMQAKALREELELLRKRQEVLLFLATSPHSTSRERALLALGEVSQQMTTVKAELDRLEDMRAVAGAEVDPGARSANAWAAAQAAAEQNTADRRAVLWMEPGDSGQDG